MSFFNMEMIPGRDHDTLQIGFGSDPGSNQDIVREVFTSLREMDLAARRPLFITGPASLPVTFTIAHAVAHVRPAILIYDPKLDQFVVAISHDPQWVIGDLIPA